MTRDPWNIEQDRTDAQVWLWSALAEIRVARKLEPNLRGPGLDALEREVQGVLDDLRDRAKWAEYDNDTSRFVWHIQMIAACRAIQAMRGQFGDTFDRLDDVVYGNVWRAWNAGPIKLLDEAEGNI
ncbi:hypothetical protein [Burkholderia cenocepacia]|uniref:hypothetical protein n=1 Tax=Burkholderia cenocepacia TaxID=95486 RepID=UPI002B244096|nr:hypothetical protein [Burkholderia cenocepacia]MEB2500791.1 hypothetical protein [Burkholderia cenocepacia]MEB2558196.1 hypothetical protein [Burkholderia cenocepacia]